MSKRVFIVVCVIESTVVRGSLSLFLSFVVHLVGLEPWPLRPPNLPPPPRS